MSGEPEGSSAPGEPEGAKLARTMGTGALLIYGVGDMLGAGVYGLMGKTARTMGNVTWLAFVIGMFAAAATGLSYASLGSRYPRAAGAAYIVQRAFNQRMLAYVVGLTVMASGLTSMATASRVFAGYFSTFAPAAPELVTALGFALTLSFIAYRGMRESTWLNALCTFVEVGGLVFILVIGASTWGNVDYLDARSIDNPSGNLTFSLLQSGAVLTFYAFIGFEDMLNVAEEVKDVRRTLPIALLGALAITTLVYIAVAITAVSVLPSRELAESPRPLVDVALRAAPWLRPEAYTGIALFAVTNTALLNLIMGSRLVYGMARQGLLPARLARVHPKRRTPDAAILALTLIVLALVCAGDISSLARATSVLLLAVFSVINASLVVLKRRPNEQPGGFEIPTFVPIAGVLINVTLLFGAGMRELTISLAIVAFIATLYLVMRPRGDVSHVGEAPEP